MGLPSTRPGFGAAPGDATTAAARRAVRMRRETPRAVVRWRVMAPRRSAQAARRAGPYQTTWRASPDSVGRGVVRVTRVKIAVCVKQVPDATVHKRLAPATKRATPPRAQSEH